MIFFKAVSDQSERVTERLYFNGINGMTGRYGVQPITVGALARHIVHTRSSMGRQVRALQAELAQRAVSERKILALVEFLATELVAARSGAVDETEDWFSDAARMLFSILAGDAPDAAGDALDAAGDVHLLAQQLRQDAVAVLVRMVGLLQDGQGAALARWLLGWDGETFSALRAGFESRFDQASAALQRRYLSAETGGIVDAQGVLRADWIAEVCETLHQLPVASVSAISNIDVISHLRRSLVQALAGPDGVSFETGSLEIRRRLAALEDSVGWHALVMRLRSVLEAVRRAELPVEAPSLVAALSGWLDGLRRMATGELGTVPWVDPRQLAQAGWAVVFPATMSETRCQAIQAALAPLLALRRQQAGERYRCYVDGEGYRPGDTASLFLRRSPRHADAANPVDPASTGVPYYVLLVGSPEEIPFDFQYQLDVQYAVGRLDFGDDLAAYAAYATNVVAAETASSSPSSEVIFFGTRHPGDEATTLTADHLVRPLAQHFGARDGPWRILHVDPHKALKANLLKLLQLPRPPALLFTATHGLEFDAGHPLQQAQQGALLCQNWQGTSREVPTDSYLAADDITPKMNLSGTVLFFFGCYGAGTPRYDEYHRAAFQATTRAIAEKPFVAALPKALLALKERGALAVIGHVERAWGLSFLSRMPNRPEGFEGRERENIEVFAAAVERLLEGYPVGAALDFFDMRYAAVATELVTLYERIGDPPSLAEAYRLVELWTANQDARGYVIVGDPAVRLQRPGGGCSTDLGV